MSEEKYMAPALDWKNLGFTYLQTEGYLRADFKNGSWGGLEVCRDTAMSIHVAAAALHYGQS
jgi:branched-chain amino acid aminotransferase